LSINFAKKGMILAKSRYIILKSRSIFLKRRFVTLKRHFRKLKRRFILTKKHEKGDKILYYPHKFKYCVNEIRGREIYTKTSDSHL
jgi:hypothetical protein